MSTAFVARTRLACRLATALLALSACSAAEDAEPQRAPPAIVTAATEPLPAADGIGSFAMTCNPSHLSYDDPLIYPGQPNSSPLAVWFGNDAADELSTFDTLRASGTSSCQGGAANRSAYWASAVFDGSGGVVLPDFAVLSYRYHGPDPAPAPDGLVLVAGFNMVAPSPRSDFEWRCAGGGAAGPTIPTCPSSERVGVVVDFPSCWDGLNLDSIDHRSHVVQPSGGDVAGACPTAFPVRVPTLRLEIWYPNDGTSDAWYLQLDRMANMTHDDGATFFAHAMEAWDPDVRNTWIAECLAAGRVCAAGQLGDGSVLDASGVYPASPHPGESVVTAPSS